MSQQTEPREGEEDQIIMSLNTFLSAGRAHVNEPKYRVPAVLAQPLDNHTVRCNACAHRCVVNPGSYGSCGVRQNVDGVLQAQRGYVAARHVRAVETNTMYHVRPGARSLSFGMLGCDLRCPYCHNARLSQQWRDPTLAPTEAMSAQALVSQAVEAGCEVLCAAYNEPMVTAEWAYEVFALAKAHGLVTGMVSDGHTTADALQYMRPVMDVYRIDLKGFDAAQYRRLGGRMDAVLAAISTARSLGY